MEKGWKRMKKDENGSKWMKMDDMDERLIYGWQWIKADESGSTGSKWMKIDENGQKWMKMDEKVWKWMKDTEMDDSGWKRIRVGEMDENWCWCCDPKEKHQEHTIVPRTVTAKNWLAGGKRDADYWTQMNL